jgi:hypothetical protein
MRYTASSVKKALEKTAADNALYSEGLKNLKCPLADLIHENGRQCHGTPNGCPEGNSQTCVRRVHIYWSKSRKSPVVAVLNFRYTVSPASNEGFIASDDAALERLIAKEYISKNELVIVN